MVRRRLGVNIGPPLDFSPNSLLLKDVAKSCRAWFSQNTDNLSPFNTAEALTLRPEDGYPILAPGKAAATLILREMTDTGSSVPLYPGGTYVLTFRGTGRVSVHFDAAFTETTTGHMEFLVTAGTGGILIKIEESDPTDPVHDLKCFQKKYEDSLGQPFVDEWLDDVAQLPGPIRDMDIGETNFNQLGSFADRATPGFYTWTLREKGGWPLELRAALANASGRALWSQMPHQFSPADAAQWARFLHDRTSKELILGNSNEVWNSIFTTDTFTGEQGQYTWFNNLGVSQGLGGGDAFLGLIQAYARDTRVKFEAIETELVDLSRVVRDVGGWIAEGAGEFFNDQVLSFEALDTKADQLSIAPYPGTSVFDAAKSAPQMAQEAYDDVANVARFTDIHKSIADSHGVALGFYEGGHGVESTNTADGPLVTAVHDDPLSERLTAEMWAEVFYRAGGDPWASSFMAYGRGWAKPFGHKRFPGQEISLAPKWRGMASFAQSGKGGVRVQNGVVSIGAGGALTETVNLPVPVDVEKAFVRVTNALSTATGQTGGQSSGSPLRDLSIEVEITDSTTLTFTRLATGQAFDHDVAWEVISYEGPAGGEYEFKVRGVGKATLANGTAEARVDLSGPISQPLRCAAFRSYLSCNSSSNPYGAALSTVDVDPATEELVVKRSATSVEVDIGWCVVEFTGSAWAVARYVHEFATGGNLEAVGPMLAADDKTFLFASQRIQAGQNGLDEVGFLMAPISGTLFARLRVGADNASAGGYEIVAFQVAAADLFVQHSGTVFGNGSIGSLDTIYPAALPTPLASRHNAAGFFTAETNTGVANHPMASWAGQLRTPAGFRADRSWANAPSDIVWNVVEFPDPDIHDIGGECWLQLSLTGELDNATPGGRELSGTVALELALAGDLTALGDLSGSTSLDLQLAGAMSALGDLAGSALLSILNAGSISGFGNLGGDLSLAILNAGSISAYGDLSGTCSVGFALTGVLTDASSGSLSGQVSLAILNSGSISAYGNLSGSVSLGIVVAGTISAVESPAGDLGGVVSIAILNAGSISALGNPSGSASLSLALAGFLTDANAPVEPADPGAPSQQIPPGGGPAPGAGLGGFIGADGALVPLVGTDATPALSTGRASAAVRRAARAKRQLRLTADGRKLIGWSDATISSSLESAALSFSLRGQSSSFGLRVGAEVQLSFDDQLLMLGWADAVKSRLTASSKSLEVTGRDRCGDLVDGSIALPQSELVGQTVEGIARTLCAPHFIAVLREAEVGAPFDRFALQPGESAWAAIERACRLRGVLATSNPRGNLVLVKPGALRAQVPITFGRDGNGLEADVSGTMQDRFARVIVRGQEPQSEFVEIEEAVTVEAQATDAAVRSNRQVVVVADTSLDQSTAQRLAEWEVAMRAARALAITVKLQWWTQGKDGPLWEPNLLVPVQIPQLGVAGEYVVKSTKFTLGNQGEMTELQLVPPDIYEPKPALSAEEPLLEPWWTREEPIEAPLQPLEAFE